MSESEALQSEAKSLLFVPEDVLKCALYKRGMVYSGQPRNLKLGHQLSTVLIRS